MGTKNIISIDDSTYDFETIKGDYNHKRSK